MNREGLFHELEAATGIGLVHSSVRTVAGGCTNEAILADSKSGETFFLKLGEPDATEPFLSEKKSLKLLRATNTIRVPEPLATGIFDGEAVLVLEALNLRPFSPGNQGKLGAALAKMHQSNAPQNQFGADFDNFIGATPQPNPWKSSWADFFTEHRLEHQFRFAEAAGRPFSGAAQITSSVHRYLDSLDISPSLIHGDLWGGNVSDTSEGVPVIFDPAAYFGDREADMAFTKLFGGFDPSFYQAYREVHPEPSSVRHEIYNLYHLLNHDHLFGGHYRKQAMDSINTITQALP